MACNLHAASLGGRLVRANNFSVLELHTIGFLRKGRGGQCEDGIGLVGTPIQHRALMVRLALGLGAAEAAGRFSPACSAPVKQKPSPNALAACFAGCPLETSCSSELLLLLQLEPIRRSPGDTHIHRLLTDLRRSTDLTNMFE